ncbi:MULTISPECIES: HPP family protein [unclassified Pseudoalteromonas]|uniref:HPP family protein n=1 Tax=unclassified Pseudoalteromonas TaxID=194690 RepID=UPI0025B52729|nr:MULTISPECIES: HPP family protein [unclassified Pseudoalteromonas]MDN3380020.1 HPP family protein [Pseudoalteromonas sp. APC 3893]MDN3388359.1 HPP family protein [Pseudoalteromonas sp. APC 4017]
MSNGVLKAISAGVFSAITLSVLVFLDSLGNYGVWLMAPFGATAVLVFGVPSSPLAKAKNVIGGHFLTALIGVIFVNYIGVDTASIAMATGLAISMMMLTNTVHPAAGANPILIMVTGQNWVFLITPVLLGTIFIVLCGYLSQWLLKEYLFRHKKTA